MIRIENYMQVGMNIQIRVFSDEEAKLRIDGLVRSPRHPSLNTSLVLDITKGEQNLNYSFPLSAFMPQTVIDFIARRMTNDEVNGTIEAGEFEISVA
ncbi:MAG: hypothetical protein ABI758_01085 [Candidatus Woesebacteria bacterium]